jgi:Holliday junction resolvase RusA-like endonuclease
MLIDEIVRGMGSLCELILAFQIPDCIHGKDRWRYRTHGKGGKVLPFPQKYNPVAKEESDFRAEVWKRLVVGDQLSNQFIIKPCPPRWTVALKVRILFEYPILKNTPKFVLRDIDRGLMVPKITVPDVSNLVKFVEDACNDIVWKDDNRIAWLEAIKIHGPKGPRTIVEVYSIGENPYLGSE